MDFLSADPIILRQLTKASLAHGHVLPASVHTHVVRLATGEPRCGERMKIIATVTDPTVVRRILACIGLPARPPPVAPAREREQGKFGFEG